MPRRRSSSGRWPKASAPAVVNTSRYNVAAPLDPGEFNRLMAPFGPFERAPVVAVAVSGGPDSMALCSLADGWARGRGGRVQALTVDHGLRPESADEAACIAGWLGGLGIGHAVLSWRGSKPASGIQAAARAARYRLLDEWCRAAGVLHLLLAHHQDDQAETLLLRLERGSGLDGLAAMAGAVERPGPRLLRPLLGVPGGRLRATLEARGLPWVEDPSNHDRRFARVRLRQLMPALADQGVGAGRLGRTASALGRARSIMDAAVASFLAGAVTPHPAGFCWLDAERYGAAPDEIARRALTRLLLCLGGGLYPPRSDRLERLHRALAGGAFEAGRTLGGCRILPRSRGVLICREPSAAVEEAPLAAGQSVVWDGRYRVRAAASAKPTRDDTGDYTVRRLGDDGWREIAARDATLRRGPVPGSARPSLPAVFGLDGIVAVPHLGFRDGGHGGGGEFAFTADFRPTHSLAPAGFAFAGAGG